MKIVFFFFLLSFISSDRLPKFEDYPVKTIYQGSISKLDMKNNPLAKMFRTQLKYAIAKGPNFAGHYTIAIWGCGTECQNYAIVDLKNGKVLFPKGEAGMTTEGLIFRLNSNLIILDPITKETVDYYKNDLPERLFTRFYKINNGKLELIDSSRSIQEYTEKIRP